MNKRIDGATEGILQSLKVIVMLKHRCPWCGEWLPRYKPSMNYLAPKEPPICPNCKKPFTLYEIKTLRHFLRTGLKWFVILTLLFETKFALHFNIAWAKNIWFYIGCILLLIYLTIVTHQQPMERFYDRKEDNGVFAFLRKERVAVYVQWAERKNKGLWNPKKQIEEGEIFPAYFKDQAGNLISSGLCVVLEEIKWTGKRQCNCEISFVLDDVPAKKYLQPNNQFYLYYYDRQIATADIL